MLPPHIPHMYFTRDNLLVISIGAENLRSHLRSGGRVHVIEFINKSNVLTCSKDKTAYTILRISFEVRIMRESSNVLRDWMISKSTSSGRPCISLSPSLSKKKEESVPNELTPRHPPSVA